MILITLISFWESQIMKDIIKWLNSKALIAPNIMPDHGSGITIGDDGRIQLESLPFVPNTKPSNLVLTPVNTTQI